MGETQEEEIAGKRQLPLQTIDLTAGFMIWVMVSTLLPFIREDIALTPDLAAWVVAIPVVLGSALRIPFGYLAGRFGARVVYCASFAALLFPIAFISAASTGSDLIIGGIFLGIAGAIFSVGVTSLPKYFPQARQGFVNGVYGLGNLGTALTSFSAPVVATHVGWQQTVRLYLILTAAMVVANLVLGDRAERKLVTPVATQFRAIRADSRLWVYSLFYFITFGSFVALTMVMPDFLVGSFGIDGVGAGIAVGIFMAVASCIRILGGWLADRHDPYRLLAIVFAGMAVGSLALAVMPGIAASLAGLYTLSVFCGIGNGVVFKLVPSAFSEQAGLANGFVAMMGGFGGFFPPLVLSASLALTGSQAGGFLLFTGGIVLCLAITATSLWKGRRRLNR